MCSHRGIVVVIVVVCGWIGMGGLGRADTVALTTPSDAIFSIYGTVGGGNSTAAVQSGAAQAGTYNSGESAASAFDGSLSTKYCIYNTSHTAVDVGFYTTPSSGLSVVNSVQFATANDSPGRDPLTIVLEGSRSSGDLTVGTAWTPIYSGTIGLNTDPGRQAWGSAASIANTTAYTSYRLLVTSVRDAAGGSYLTQFSEVKLSGNLVPEPSTIALVVSGMVGLLAYAWRKRK
jgi:hypothetical protein